MAHNPQPEDGAARSSTRRVTTASSLITREAATDIVLARLTQGRPDPDDPSVFVPLQTTEDFARSCFENGATPRVVSRALMHQLLTGRLYPDLTDYDGKPIDWSQMPRAGRGPGRKQRAAAASKAQSLTGSAGSAGSAGAETDEPKGEGSQSAEMELIAALQNDVSRLTKELDDLRLREAVDQLQHEVEVLRLRVSELETAQAMQRPWTAPDGS